MPDPGSDCRVLALGHVRQGIAHPMHAGAVETTGPVIPYSAIWGGWLTERLELGQNDRGQPELFVAGSLCSLLPDDHILVRVVRVLPRFAEWFDRLLNRDGFSSDGNCGTDCRRHQMIVVQQS
jgi:hypothetical protein